MQLLTRCEKFDLNTIQHYIKDVTKFLLYYYQ